MSTEAAEAEDCIWADLAAAAERGELKPIGNARGKAELDAIRARVRDEHGEDLEAFLRAVYADGGGRTET